ncbi:MAG: MOSC domain-containing protein, partial [Sphingopyxis sp.]|nr:MOSC domain-containing protein [Sphingopyxis sp.]
MSYAIDALLAGKARAFRGDEESAIAKDAVDGARRVGFLGIAGDEQADLTVHGGIDKAIHHYPRDHYRWWQHELGDHALLGAAGAFGENISTEGLVETEAAIGDRYRLGSALVEISQGRQPCWKLGHRFGIAGVPATVVKTRRSGWYYRVIEEG